MSQKLYLLALEVDALFVWDCLRHRLGWSVDLIFSASGVGSQMGMNFIKSSKLNSDDVL